MATVGYNMYNMPGRIEGTGSRRTRNPNSSEPIYAQNVGNGKYTYATSSGNGYYGIMNNGNGIQNYGNNNGGYTTTPYGGRSYGMTGGVSGNYNYNSNSPYGYTINNYRPSFSTGGGYGRVPQGRYNTPTYGVQGYANGRYVYPNATADYNYQVNQSNMKLINSGRPFYGADGKAYHYSDVAGQVVPYIDNGAYKIAKLQATR